MRSDMFEVPDVVVSVIMADCSVFSDICVCLCCVFDCVGELFVE